MRNIIRLSIVLLFSIACSNVFAESSSDYDEIALDAAAQKEKIMTPYLNAAIQAEKNEKKITAPYMQDAIQSELQARETVDQYVNQNTKQDVAQKIPSSNVLIFVSFSMPSPSLEAYLRDAKKIHATLVLRGLIDNSFKKTFTRISEVVKAAGGGGFEVNPLLFKQFGIRNVPAVVILPSVDNCKANQSCVADVIKGNISLPAALTEIRNKGTVSVNAADTALSMLRESSHA